MPLAAQTAMDRATVRLKEEDGRLPEVADGTIGVADCLALLERNLSRHHPPHHD